MRLYLEKAYKLHGKLEFQGLPISVENRAGSSRHWHDEHSGDSGSTKMKYPYGYIRGTLGTDGDEVDVFVGPSKDSTKVFVVTQMKKPGFREVDEQKVMLGFHSASEAKAAYLHHYDDPKFFGSMKEFPMADFKEKLTSHKGKLIKHLFLADPSAKLEKAIATFKDLENAGMEKGVVPKEGHTMDKSCEHVKEGVTCEKCNGTHSTSDVLKGLNSRLLSMVKRTKERLAAPKADPETQTTEVSLVGPQVAQAAFVSRKFEIPVVASVEIPRPESAATPLAPDFMSECGGCGYVHKSLSNCPRCAGIAAMNREATPIWRR